MQQPPSSRDVLSSQKKPSAVRWILPTLAIVLIVALFAGVLQALRGASTSSHLADGPSATPTPLTTAATTASGTTTPVSSTPTPGATPASTSSTGNPGTQTGAVRVTQNQNKRPLCADDPTPYTVVLFNGGIVTANWHVSVPKDVADVQGGGAIMLSQPLVGPFSGPSSWAAATPQDGSIAPGKTASFVMNVFWPMPCGGTTYHASVQLSFPAGTSQSDIPLTYAGTGPARYVNVVLVSGSMNITQPCPAPGTAPAPFTFAIKNTGNYPATFLGVVPFDTVGSQQWATFQGVFNPTKPREDYLYPGQIFTITVSPVAGVSCGGTAYHTRVYYTLPDKTPEDPQETMIFTDTFQ